MSCARKLPVRNRELSGAFSVTGVLSSIARYIYFFDWELVVPGQKRLARISPGNEWSQCNKRQQKYSRTFRESNLSKTGHYAARRISQKTGLRALLD